MAGNDIWNVRFAAGGLEDLVCIVQHVLEHEGVESAKKLSVQLQTDVKKRLTTLPYRGRPVPELEHLSHECRELYCKPYRRLYLPIEADRTVWILLVAHTRQSIQDMLRKRLLYYPANR